MGLKVNTERTCRSGANASQRNVNPAWEHCSTLVHSRQKWFTPFCSTGFQLLCCESWKPFPQIASSTKRISSVSERFYLNLCLQLRVRGCWLQVPWWRVRPRTRRRHCKDCMELRPQRCPGCTTTTRPRTTPPPPQHLHHPDPATVSLASTRTRRTTGPAPPPRTVRFISETSCDSGLQNMWIICAIRCSVQMAPSRLRTLERRHTWPIFRQNGLKLPRLQEVFHEEDSPLLFSPCLMGSFLLLFVQTNFFWQADFFCLQLHFHPIHNNPLSGVHLPLKCGQWDIHRRRALLFVVQNSSGFGSLLQKKTSKISNWKKNFVLSFLKFQCHTKAQAYIHVVMEK